MKTTLIRPTTFPQTDVRLAPRKRPVTDAASTLRRKPARVPSASWTRPGSVCCRRDSTHGTFRRLSILPQGIAATTAVDNALNKVIFALLGVCGLVMGATCFWNLQALVVSWASFVRGWASVLQT